MLRWTIFLFTLAAWAGSMALVYKHTRPDPVKETILGANEAFLVLFDEDVELERTWRIFADFREKPQAQPGAKAPGIKWTGRDQQGLSEIGRINTELKRKSDSMVEQQTNLQLRIPGEARSAMLEALGMVTVRIGCNYSYETGLDLLSIKAESSLGFNVEVFGIRDGGMLNVRQIVSQRRQKLLENAEKIEIGSRAAPSVELSPFQRQPKIREGYEWDFAMVDVNTLFTNVADNAKPQVKSVRAKVMGRVSIEHEGQTIPVFEVATPDRSAVAWYSADGNVIKQAFHFANAVDVMLVRVNNKPATRTQRPRK